MTVVVNAAAYKGSKAKAEVIPGPPELQLSGGRRLAYERSFSSQREVKLKKGFFTRLLDIVAGAPEYHDLVRPYSVAADSRGQAHRHRSRHSRSSRLRFRPAEVQIHQREGKEAFRAPSASPSMTGQLLRHRLGSRKDLRLRSDSKLRASNREYEGRRRLLQASHGNRGGFCCADESMCPIRCVTRYCPRHGRSILKTIGQNGDGRR